MTRFQSSHGCGQSPSLSALRQSPLLSASAGVLRPLLLVQPPAIGLWQIRADPIGSLVVYLSQSSSSSAIPTSTHLQPVLGRSPLSAGSIAKRVDLHGKRVLEVGCGRAHLGTQLIDKFGATYVGIDIVEKDTWSAARPDMTLQRRDISTEPSSDLGDFDVIISLAVLEHVVHPYAMLGAMFQRLRPGGVAYLAANLYRGPKASHRYRQVYFPWPHLLFGDSVWREFYRKIHNCDWTFSWVNKLTYAQYLTYFDMLGYRQQKVWLTPSTFDADFYARFEDLLSRYPRFDLAHDFVYAVLERPKVPIRGADAERRQLRAQVERIDAELAAIRASKSWRVTAPLRAVRKRSGR
jgi:SAM-dependent methyltransferase